MTLSESEKMQLMLERPVKGYWILLFKIIFSVATVIVIYESLIPSNATSVSGHFDKVAHFGAYFTLVCLAALSFPKAKLWIIVGLMICLGAALEGAQGLMNLGRSASIGDLIANILGVCAPVFSWVGCIWIITSRNG
ncbi:MAG: VanZ family protein [Maricaulaceae bacterium]